MNSASRPAAGQGSVADAKPQASKPSASAAARIAPFGSSEVQVVIVGRRSEARPAVGEDGAESGPRLDLHVPGLDGRKLAPRNVAEIIEDGEVGGGGEIG